MARDLAEEGEEQQEGSQGHDELVSWRTVILFFIDFLFYYRVLSVLITHNSFSETM